MKKDKGACSLDEVLRPETESPEELGQMAQAHVEQDREKGSLADILLHVWRFQITTVTVVAARFFNGKISPARGALRRLSQRGFLVTRPLLGREVYFQLSPRGAREIGAPEELARPLGPQALPRAFGVLLFCNGEGRTLRRFTRGEFADLGAELNLSGIPFNDYFIDETEEVAVLVRIIVDLGGDAERLMRKMLSIAKTLSQRPEALKLLVANAFQFLIITSSEQKAHALRQAGIRICPNLPCRFHVEAALLNLLPNFYEQS